MAPDRKAAKGSVVKKGDEDPELDDAFGAAHKLQLSLAQENNRHTETMRRHDLGFFGRAFGGEKSAPTFIAAIAALFGVVGVGYSIYAGNMGNAEIWSQQTERLLAFTVACLAFIFGRGAK